MDVRETDLPGVFVIVPRRFGDARGFFSETWNSAAWEAAGLPEVTWKQDNHSMSRAVGTVRGLHYQNPPQPQAKLVRCGQGALYDVAIDARRGSPHYGRWVGAELTAENGHQLYLPEGFLHGFVTRAPNTEIVYKCSDTYAAGTEGAVGWDSMGIDWGLGATVPTLSDADRVAPAFADWESPFVFEEGAPAPNSTSNAAPNPASNPASNHEPRPASGSSSGANPAFARVEAKASFGAG